jgi:HEAT repeat protein
MDDKPDNPVLERRFQAVKRILKWIAKRVVLEEAAGAQSFLEQLYFNEILTFEELPPEVQYRVNTIRLAEDLQENSDEYVTALFDAKTSDDAVVLLKAFRRTAPVLMEKCEWPVLLELAKAVDKAAQETNVFSGGTGLPANPLIFVFYEYMDQMAQCYEGVDKEARQIIDEIASRMGPLGIEVLIKVLGESEDRGVRKSAVDTLIRKGQMARSRVRQILDDPQQPWFLQRNALIVLGHVGVAEDDGERAKRLLRHSKPKLREEALNALMRLVGREAEPLVIAALRDRDKRVQRRAAASLGFFKPLSETSVNNILDMIKKSPNTTRKRRCSSEPSEIFTTCPGRTWPRKPSWKWWSRRLPERAGSWKGSER